MENNKPLDSISPEAQVSSPSFETGLPGATELLKKSCLFYREHFTAISSVMIVPAIFIVVSELSIKYNLYSFIAAILLNIVFSFLAGIAVIQIISENGQLPAGVSGAYKRTISLILPVFWISIISGFAMGGGFILLVVPGIIVALYLMFSQYVVILEGRRGLAALVTSWMYAKNYLGAIFGRAVIFAITLMIFMAIMGVITASISGDTDTFFNPAKATSLKFSFSRLLNSLVQILILTPISAAYFYQIYAYLRMARGDIDFESQEAKNARTKIVGLSILGIVVAVLIAVFAMIFAVFLFEQFFPSGALKSVIKNTAGGASFFRFSP